MKNIIAISKNEFEELQAIIDDLQCFLESLLPKYQTEICTFPKQEDPCPTEAELSRLF